MNAKDLYAALNAQLEEEKLFSDKGKDSALPESKRKERKEQEDARFLLDQLMMSGALPDPSLGPLSLDLVSKGKKLEESEGRVGLDMNGVMPFVDVSRQGDVSEYGVKYGGGDPSRAYELMLSQRVPMKTPGGEVEMPVVGQGSYSMPFAGGRLSAQGYVVPRQGEMPRSEYGANLMFMKRFAAGGEVEPSVDTEDRLQEKINLYRHGLISLEELTKHMRGMDPYDVARLFGGTDDNPLYKPKSGDISTLPFTPLDLPKDDDEDLEDPFLDLDKLAKRESRASEEIGAFPKVPFVNRLEVPPYPYSNLLRNPERRLAKGGEVSTTDFIRKREKGSPPEGEVPTDEYIQQMFTGTPPAERAPQRGLLPPELREAVDVPLDFLNTFIRGTAAVPIGSAYGLYQGITSDKFGTPEGVQEAGREAGKMMSKITGVPKTQAARDTLEFIGGVAEEAKIPPMPQFLTTPAPGPGSARALMKSYELAETPPVGAINVPGAKATRIFEDIPTTKTTATQYGAEFVQSPFVGRLDKMIAELPGPVQKEQFLNQLKGKFRDYEIGRAKEALKDLPDNAKITPFDLLNKIKEDFDPSRYGTSIVKPDPNDPDKFYASMDNIYKAPLGVIHLRQLATPEAEAGLSRAKDMYQALKNTTHAGINADLLNTPDAFNNYKANVNEFLRDLNQPERSVEANRLLDTAQASVNLYGRLSDAVDTINYPTLSSVYKTLQAEQKALSKRFDYNEAIRTATQSAINDLDDIFPGTKVKLYDDIQALSGSDLALRTKAASNIRNAFSPTQNTVREVFRQSMSGLRELLEKTYNNPKSPMAQFGYQGQHSGLGRTPTQTGIPNEIAFSRYSEHTTDVPDLGKVDGIYVHELQSDRLDDIRKKGPLGGSPTKDLPKAAELGKKLQNLTEQAAIENQRYLDNPTIEQKEKLTELQEQQKRTQEQLNKWMKRISEGQYKIKESFVGMEESPQVIQQLMAKNVIAAAIQMGKNFVAFPGAESSQAQLYEKLPNNLKQVVKDLGPGFEYRPITLTTPDGQDVMHPGVVWDKYGAGRIGAEGVPFKKGGEVRTEDFIKKVLK